MQDLPFASIEELEESLRSHRYVAGRSLATTLFLATKLDKPLLLEGEAGVGKTEVGKVLAEILGARLIRLQCYEGIDVNNAVYEWSYARQMLQIRMLETAGADAAAMEREIFSPKFLVKRPLLQALETDGGRPPVLLIDEIDRSDDEFEAFLLELLSDYQISIPELGTITAQHPPAVVITSNRTREIHDALKRRCLYFWIDYPSVETEYQVVLARIPDVPPVLARQVSRFIAGPARMLPYLQALTLLDQRRREDVAAAVHAHFARRRDDFAVLDRALGAFLLGADSSEPRRPPPVAEPGDGDGAVSGASGETRQLNILDDDDEPDVPLALATYSAAEVLRHKDF